MINTILLILIMALISKMYISNKINGILKNVNSKLNKLENDVEETFINSVKSVDPNNITKCKKKTKIILPKPIQKKQKQKIDLTPIVTVDCQNKYTGYNHESVCYNYLKLD